MRNYSLPMIILTLSLILLLPQCKKSQAEKDKEILNKSIELTGNASINMELKKLKEALKNAKTDFERAKIHEDISSLESEKGDIRGLLKSANEALKYQPNLARAHYLRGMAYIRMGRLDEAENELKTAIQLDERLAAAHFEMGNLYYKKGKMPPALKEYIQTVKYDDKHFQAYNNLGVIYFITGKSKEAEQALKKVAQLRPNYAKVYKNLGVLYDLKLKDPGQAIANYKKYLKLRPNAPERRVVKIWIANLGG